MRRLKNGWRVSEEYSEPKQAEYHQRMAAEMRKMNIEKLHKPGVQAASTLENLKKHEDPNYKRDWGAKIEGEWKAETDINKVFPHSVEVYAQYKEYHERQGNNHNFGLDMRETATTTEKRDSAIHHFMVSPPADMSKEDPARIVGLIEIISKTPEYVWKKISPVQAAWHWLTGKKVKSKGDDKKDWRDA